MIHPDRSKRRIGIDSGNLCRLADHTSRRFRTVQINPKRQIIGVGSLLSAVVRAGARGHDTMYVRTGLNEVRQPVAFDAPKSNRVVAGLRNDTQLAAARLV